MDWEKLLTELDFRTSRSSGAGGQHVNKTETKVEVLFHVNNSQALNAEEKEIILQKLAASINVEGILAVNSQKSRSQFSNKENALEKLKLKLEKALIPKAKRVRTKPTKGAIEERLAEKKMRSEIKEARKKPNVKGES